jgi:uncharacterized protein (TIGR02117 family)
LLKITFINLVKKFIILLLIPLFFTLLYLLVASIFTFFPTNIDNKIQDKKAYIIYNKMHCDIVLKISKNSKKWNQLLNLLKNASQGGEKAPISSFEQGYLVFGWGDKETYLNTPTWNKLQVSTTIKALFINTPSLMHVAYYSDIKKFKKFKIINVSKQQLQALEESIFKSFNFKANQHYRAYSDNDLFYPSKYQYNLFNTCNTWTGDRLRESNISMSYWTPLSQNVISSLP